MIEKHTVELFEGIFKKLKPPENIPISEWADNYRRLPAESSAEPGKWKTSRTPYLKKPMDSISDPEVKKVVMMTSAQVGKSEIILNVLGYYTHIDPSPMLIIQPTVETGKNFSKERITPTFRDTPVLADLVSSNRNTILKKEFAGGFVAIVGANAPAGLASRPIRILLCDEIDRYPVSAGEEGDPLTLGEKRTTTFPHTAKKVYVSTPTIEGISRIEHEFKLGTMEEWEVPCPGCGEYQTITWDKIKFTLDDKTRKLDESREIECLCVHCGELNNEISWKSGEGRWSENAENKEIKSFHLSSLISPWKSWDEVVKSFLSAKNDREQLKVWTNTELGEPFAIFGDNVNEIQLYERRERYGAEIPEGVLVLTASVDVQDDRFEVEVCGWGRNYESWGIKYIKIFGNLELAETWDRLDYFLCSTFKFADETELSIAHVCLDTGGHFTDKAYKFCKKPHKYKITGIKGYEAKGVGFLHKTSKNNKEKLKIQIVGVNTGKETVMNRLQIDEIGENYCHFPKDKSRGYDLEYFQGLTSEHQVTEIKNGVPRVVWKLKRGRVRNEPFDLRNYNTVALELMMPIDFDKLEQLLRSGVNHSKMKEVKPDDGKRTRRRTTSGVS